jgi:hypothetical protein
MNFWIYRDKPVKEIGDFPTAATDFVYKITRIRDGKFYIGKKRLFFSKTSIKTVLLKSGIKRKKKIKSLVPSDWKTYWSSSEELLKDVEKLGLDAFTREILCFCSNKGSSSYYELKYQMDARVLEIGDKSYNGIVNARIHHSHVRKILTKD